MFIDTGSDTDLEDDEADSSPATKNTEDTFETIHQEATTPEAKIAKLTLLVNQVCFFAQLFL